MARTLTGNDPRREQRLQSLLLDRIAAKYERRIAREIAQTMRNAVGKPLNAVQYEHEQNLTAILNSMWGEAIAVINRHLSGIIKARARFETKKSVPMTETAISIATDFVREFGAKKVTQIASTTMDDINYVISESMDEGLTEAQITDIIRVAAPIKSAARAQSIARTETGAAASFSAQATASEAGVDMMRQWVTNLDEDTRQTHRDANGQKVGMFEPFTVGGVKLMYPCDPNANAPHETINCRCAVVFVLK